MSLGWVMLERHSLVKEPRECLAVYLQSPQLSMNEKQHESHFVIRFDYEYEIEYEYDFSNLVCVV